MFTAVALASITWLFTSNKQTQKMQEPEESLKESIIEVQHKPSGTICEYIDVLHENITPVDFENDDIQENLGYQNNKVGLYIYAEVEDFVPIAAEMINSNGGDWGYVLIPFNVKDDNATRWGRLFEQLAKYHLIPIVQLWDLDLEANKMDEQIRKSAGFLNALKWPIKPRYISAYNEPNDADFWKGDVNPAQYAQVLENTINTFKALNDDFFVMNGALNISARTGGKYLDAEVFMIRMNNQVPGIFKRLDGWASHPYPQPDFSGSPQGRGRDSIKAYEWELDILRRRFGVKTSNLPVFITETGWAHKEGEGGEGENGGNADYKYNQHQVADNFKYAFETVWLPDPRVAAVTPFTIRYNPPHDNFSWLTQDNNPYPQYNAVKDIKKTEGRPPIVTYIKTKVLECK